MNEASEWTQLYEIHDTLLKERGAHEGSPFRSGQFEVDSKKLYELLVFASKYNAEIGFQKLLAWMLAYGSLDVGDKKVREFEISLDRKATDWLGQVILPGSVHFSSITDIEASLADHEGSGNLSHKFYQKYRRQQSGIFLFIPERRCWMMLASKANRTYYPRSLWSVSNRPELFGRYRLLNLETAAWINKRGEVRFSRPEGAPY